MKAIKKISQPKKVSSFANKKIVSPKTTNVFTRSFSQTAIKQPATSKIVFKTQVTPFAKTYKAIPIKYNIQARKFHFSAPRNATFSVKPTVQEERLSSINPVTHHYSLGWRTQFFQSLQNWKNAVSNPNSPTTNWDTDVEALKKWKNNPELSNFAPDNVTIEEANFEELTKDFPPEFKTPISKELNETRARVNKTIDEWKNSLSDPVRNFYFGDSQQAYDHICKLYNIQGRPTEEQLKKFNPAEHEKNDQKEAERIKAILGGRDNIGGPSGQMFRYELKTASPRVADKVVEDLKKSWGETKWFTAYYQYGHPSAAAVKEANEWLKKNQGKF